MLLLLLFGGHTLKTIGLEAEPQHLAPFTLILIQEKPNGLFLT